MARYTGPVCRQCRREGVKLFLKGERCLTNKCAVERRNYIPGQHGPSKQRKLSQYGLQLREKQKMRRQYGVGERQFRTYFAAAFRQKGVTGELFLRLLERRLDNVIYRLGFASSRPQARQLVAHGNIQVDGKKVDVASFLVKPNMKVSVVDHLETNAQLVEIVGRTRMRSVPGWLSLDGEKNFGTILSLPSRAEIDTQVNEQLIVEFYSK